MFQSLDSEAHSFNKLAAGLPSNGMNIPEMRQKSIVRTPGFRASAWIFHPALRSALEVRRSVF